MTRRRKQNIKLALVCAILGAIVLMTAIKIKDTSNYGLHKNLGSMTYGVHLGETYTDWDEGSFIAMQQQLFRPENLL